MEEEESLFGSPPPSPRTGRSPSPVLALPNSSGSIVNLQNVGTIALPGSHCNSEPFSNSLALSLSFRSHSPSSGPSTPSTSRASSQGPSKGRRSRRRRNQELSSEPIVRPPPPEIPLPDPSGPLPTNWLRSQSALLGHAGLVGGVKPATLSSRHSRGSTAVNPIVIDDDRSTQTEQFYQHQPSLPSAFPLPFSELPTPFIPEVVQILVKEREIFPLLKSILKFLEKKHLSARYTTTSDVFQPQSSSSGPALKKRRLNKVPAGATDWDVPYPFKPGEGPQAYWETWERDREQQLLSQLVRLIKSATHKAAMRKYLKQNPQSTHALQWNLPDSLKKELEHAMPKDILADASNGPAKSDQSSAPALSPFDELLASLLTVNPSSNQREDSSNVNSLFKNTTLQGSTPEPDKALLDSWVSILQAFGMTGTLEQQPENPTSTSNPQDTSSPSDFPMEFGSWDAFPDVSEAQGYLSYSNNPLAMDVDGYVPAPADLQSLSLDMSSTSTNLSELLPSISFASNSFGTSSGTPSLVHSPIPSLSSFGDTELLTSEWPSRGSSSADVSSATAQNELDGKLSLFLSNQMGIMGDGQNASMRMFEDPQGHDHSGKTQPAMAAQTPSLSGLGLALNALDPTSVGAGTSSVFTPPIVRPFHPSDRSSNKTDLLKRARARRTQLAEELVKARTQLWETTVEHAVLTRLVKHYM